VETLVLALDLFGTFVFALSGAMAGVRHRLDLFGVLVLAYAAGTAGGITRDLLIGAVPPASIADWRYIVVPVLAGLATFWWHPALAFGLNPLAAVLLGMLTGIGGGMVRDVLVTETPTVLHAELYAVAALAGAVVVVGGQLLRLPPTPLAIGGAVLCFGLRLVAIRRGWGLPVARLPERPTDQEKKEDCTS
jgi:uncharacterized membrane protein YeiH